MKDMIVTIVIPVYNVEKYLNKAVASVINQTYKNLEIILVDDGSVDKCPQICDEWAKKDDRIKVIHKENQGLGMARNTGIENATGDYICFFDGDDYIEHDTIEKCVNVALKDKSDVVHFGHNGVLPNGKEVRRTVPDTPEAYFEGEEIINSFLPMAVSYDAATGEHWRVNLSACMIFCSLEIIRSSGWRFVSEREIIAEDFYSIFVLYRYIKRLSVIPEVLYHYTVNDSSLTHTFKSDRVSRLIVFYNAMVKESEAYNYSDVLKIRIKTVFLNNIIAAMKQIVASSLSLKEKLDLLRSATEDVSELKVFESYNYNGEKIQKKILFTAMKMKMSLLLFIIIKAKNSN